MKKIISVTLPLVLASSLTFADNLKPTGLYLKGFYDTSVHNERFTTPQFGAGLGYKFGILRAEGKYGYGTGAHRHTNSVSALGYLDLDNATPLSPYIGLGLGQEHAHLLFNVTKNKTHGLGAAGVRAYLNPNLALDVGYVTQLRSNLNEGRASLGLTYHF